jgi:tetratricopeptide (TPR) repeat protein
MSIFQLFLFILAGSILYLFFKQLFSDSYPKRGVDFEAKTSDEQIGGINRPDKIFSKPKVELSRLEQLSTMADEAIEKGNFDEAKKALQSALIIEKDNIDILQKSAFVFTQIKEFDKAKECYENILKQDENDDMAHVLLANTLHKLEKNEEAQKHHEKAISLDPDYAPHHFNYANTLYDIGRKEEALVGYKKAYELDSSLDVAKDMIAKIEAKNE